jgi:hypothetical protein
MRVTDTVKKALIGAAAAGAVTAAFSFAAWLGTTVHGASLDLAELKVGFREFVETSKDFRIASRKTEDELRTAVAGTMPAEQIKREFGFRDYRLEHQDSILQRVQSDLDALRGRRVDIR